ncbi:hypothetical protein [Yoonia maritima]|uniref:hypothetical protein n=1 Tax=Yoonia maritima TaxID=1435347 RepID=UPI000D0FF2AE|nr:hypothetical protein [Yoonia maritima]
MNIEDWPILKSRGFLALYSFTQKGVFPESVAGAADVALIGQRAEQSVELLRAASYLPDACTVIVRSANRTSVATLQGGLVCEGDQSLNIGLFLPKARGLDVVELEQPSERPQFDDLGLQTLLNICERIDRCEVARVILLRIGDKEISIRAHRGKFDVLTGAEAPLGIAALVRGAIDAGEEVAYSIAESDGQSADTPYTIGDLLGLSELGFGASDLGGNPLNDAYRSLSLRRVAEKLSDGGVVASIEVRDLAGKIILKLSVGEK